MARLGKLAVGVLAGLLLALALVVADARLTGGRWLATLTGREPIAAACRPAVMRVLATRGFEPRDLDFDTEPGLSGLVGGAFESAFHFADGAAGTIVEGHMRCVLDGGAAKVEVETTALPERTGTLAPSHRSGPAPPLRLRLTMGRPAGQVRPS